MAKKRGRKKRRGRKPVRVKIKGDPFAVIDRMLRRGSSPKPLPPRSAPSERD